MKVLSIIVLAVMLIGCKTKAQKEAELQQRLADQAVMNELMLRGWAELYNVIQTNVTVTVTKRW